MARIIYIAFLVIIAIPLADEFLNFLPKNVNNENRTLQQKKSVSNSILGIKTYLENFDDNFHGRTSLIHQFIHYKINWLKDSPLPNKLLIGKKNMLFLVDYNSMADYRNIEHFSSEEKKQLAQTLIDNKRQLNQLGIPYIIVIVPEKQRIYPEYLPENIRQVRSESRLENFKKYLKKRLVNLQLIDLNPVLLKEKKNRPQLLYFKEESHWNYLAAKLAFDTIQNSIPAKNRSENLQYVNKIFFENDLDLAMQLGKSFSYTERTVKPTPMSRIPTTDAAHPLQVSDYKLKRKPNYFISKENSKRKGKVMVYRDSYGEFLKEYFQQSYGQSLLIWTYDLNFEDVKKYRPDVVIHEIAERHLDMLIN